MCIFAQAFFVHAEFLVQFEKKVIIYLVKKKKDDKSENLIIWSGSLPSLYNAIRLYVEAEASHESCTEIL